MISAAHAAELRSALREPPAPRRLVLADRARSLAAVADDLLHLHADDGLAAEHFVGAACWHAVGGAVGSNFMRPSTLRLRTRGECALDPDRLVDVFGKQRRRFIAVLEGFGPEDWAGSTRCVDWCAHDVVRHLCDGTAIAAGMAHHTLDVSAGFDPRTSPREWLAASANESPEVTLARLVATTEELLVVARDRLARSIVFEVDLPYGLMDWTVFLLHVFWDSWIHERDVLLARGFEHQTDEDATVYATGYGVFLAASVASMFGHPVGERLELGGDGGGVFHLDDREAVMLTVTRCPTAGPPAADVADALAGRSPIAGVLGDLPIGSRAALSQLSDFFNTAVTGDGHPT